MGETNRSADLWENAPTWLGDGPDDVADLLEQQQNHWRRGTARPVEAYLEQRPELRSNAEAVMDLIGNEILLRRERGAGPVLEDYLPRFPELAERLRIHFEVERALLADTLFGAAGGLPARPVVPGYEVLDELGRGGMGVVYRAHSAGLGRPVALKMIRAGGRAGPEAVARFRAEARAVARLRHPNIVRVHEVGEAGGHPFFVQELVEGGTLADRVRLAPLPARAAARLVETLARAMHHAHEHGIVHRDLKPQNVLVTAEGTPKIIDFGLAKQFDAEADATPSGVILGTPGYMAPEQAAGRTGVVGPAADVYALGAILYELVTDRPPFRAETPLDTVLLVLHEEPVPPRLLQPRVPRDLETICLRCLEKDPARRYASALDLAGDLGRFLNDEPIAARGAGLVERLGKMARRRPGLAALVAAAACLVALLVSGLEGTLVSKATLAALVGQIAARALGALARTPRRPTGSPVAGGVESGGVRPGCAARGLSAKVSR